MNKEPRTLVDLSMIYIAMMIVIVIVRRRKRMTDDFIDVDYDVNGL